MVGVTQQELQRVLARRQREVHFRLGHAEVHVLLVLGNRLSQVRRRYIDEEVMVTRIQGGIASGGQRHALEVKHNLDRRADDVPIPWAQDRRRGAGRRLTAGNWCWCRLRAGAAVPATGAGSAAGAVVAGGGLPQPVRASASAATDRSSQE